MKLLKKIVEFTELLIMQLWVVLTLIFSMVFVAVLGATFSIFGLGELFSGATVFVWMMAGGLELAKFGIAAFLHQGWDRLNVLLRYYLLISVVILSAITSMGIFGFLSNAYEQSSTILEEENVKLDHIKDQINRNEAEITRINKAIDEVPVDRISRKMRLRAEAEPTIKEILKKNEELVNQVAQANLKIIDVKRKVGPLIYIARAFKVDIDTAVKYLILLLVSVFDPLAICLVLAVSESHRLRRGPNAKSPAEEKSKVQSLKMRFVNDLEAS